MLKERIKKNSNVNGNHFLLGCPVHYYMDQNQSVPVTFIVFGATGDLFNRKLLPAFYKLFQNQSLSTHFSIVGIARRPKTESEFRTDAEKTIRSIHKNASPQKLAEFLPHLFYQSMDFNEDAGYPVLKQHIQEIENRFETKGNRIFYLATLPEQFSPIVKKLQKHSLSNTAGFRRVIIEKPFGNDLESAQKLNTELLTVFSEDEIFRIDHYLGKELVQNLLITRFANDIFNYPWNQKFIDNVQILVAEENGIGSRGSYYENAGVLNDMVQNHLLQLVALTAMEAPKSLSSDDIMHEKIKVLKKIRFSNKKSIVLGQYSEGTIDGQSVIGYKSEKDVSRTSVTPTFAAIRLDIDTPTWKGVPFYLKTGKRLPKSAARIWLNFKSQPSKLFENLKQPIAPNHLEFRIQPDEGIALFFNVKVPGKKLEIKPYHLDFCHECEFALNTPEAYERLLMDTVQNDKTLFTSWEETRLAWKIMKPVQAACNTKERGCYSYQAGTWGPKQANELIEADGRTWHTPKEYGGGNGVY